MKNLFIVITALFYLFSCNTVRVVKPLAKSEKQVGASLGGPLIKMGDLPVFMPLTSIHGAYGITDKTTGFASVHLTAVMFGVFQTDVGFTTNIYKSKNHLAGVSISGIANAMIDRWEAKFRFLPQADINAYWHYNKKNHYVYTSLQNWFEPKSLRAHGEKQPVFWLPTLSIGHQWIKNKYHFQLETKYIGFTQNNEHLVVKYISPGNQGSLGIYFGIQRKF